MFMSETHKPNAMLVAKYILHKASPAETAWIEEWASQSTENSNWLNQFKNPEWVTLRLKQLEEIDIDAYVRDFKQRLHEREIQSRKVLKIWRWVSYPACIIICVWLFFTYKSILFPNSATQQNVSHTTAEAPLKEQPIHHQYHPALYVSHSTEEQRLLQYAASRGIVLNYKIGVESQEREISNPDSAIFDHELSDGTKITLNAASTIKHPYIFQGYKRKIELTGEAYIDAQPDSAFPFLVVVNKIHIETSGGKFNVRSHAMEQNTVITAITTDSLLVSVGPYSITLQRGQLAVIKKGAPIEVFNSTNTVKTLAYTNGFFHFKNDKANLATMELARWYGLTLTGTAPANLRVSYYGSRLTPCKNVLTLLVTSDNKSHFEVKGNKLIIK